MKTNQRPTGREKNLKRNQILMALITVLAMGWGLSVAHATIIWGPATTIAGDTDVSTNGTLLRAYNLGSTSGVLGISVSVNGVPFAYDIINGAPTAGISGYTGFGNYGAVPSATAWNALSSAYKTLLNPLYYSFAGGGFTLTLTNAMLTTGHTYEIQLWSSFIGGETITASDGNSVALLDNTGTVGADPTYGVGQFAIGTFVASGGNEVISFTASGGATGQTILNAYQLRDLSPPSEPPPLASGMTQRVVLDEPRLDLWGVQNLERLVGWLGNNGFSRLDGNALPTWMSDRITQGNAYGSVAVMTRGVAPAQLMEFTVTGKPLWYDYINAGGRIVHIGGVPFMVPQSVNVQPVEFDYVGHSPDPLLGMHPYGLYWGDNNYPGTPTWATQNWGLQNVAGSGFGVPVETTTYAFGVYSTPAMNGAVAASDWFRNINLAKPWSGLLRFLQSVDFNNDSAMSDVWRAVHYVGQGGPLPTMPALPLPIPPTPPELLTVDMKNGVLSNRHQFVRNEIVTVTTTKDPTLSATAVKLVLATTNGTALLTQQTNLFSNQATFTVNTTPYAYGPYQLIATALNGSTPVRTNTQPFGVRYVRPEAFNWQVLYNPSGNPTRAALEAVDIRDTGLEVFGGVTATLTDLAISNNLGFSIRTMPEIAQGIVADYNTHPEYFRMGPTGTSYAFLPNLPALGVLHPAIRTNSMLQISNLVASVASIPAFRPYALCNDDYDYYYGWDYTAPNPANFQTQTGAVAPTAMTLPPQTGVIPDNNAWVQWFRWTFKNVNGGYAKMETRGATNALASVRIGSMLGTFVNFWSTAPEEQLGAVAYPPYMCGTNGFNLACNYWYLDYYAPLLNTTYFVEFSRMDNRSITIWNMPNCQWATAAEARSLVFHYLAGGTKGLVYFIYNERNASMWNELKKLGPIVNRIGAVQAKLQPAPRDIGLLCSFSSACFDPNHPWDVSYAYANLLQGHFSVEPVSEDELIAGRASQYKAILLHDVNYLSQSAYNALQTYLAGGGKVLLDTTIPWSIPGASFLNVNTEQNNGLGYGQTNIVEAIKAAVTPFVKPYLNSTDIKLVASQLTAGGVPYTWFVNAQDSNEWMFARNKTLGTDGAGLDEDLPGLIAWENAQPTNYTSTISFNTLPGSKPYDLLKGQALTVTTVNGKPTVTVTMQRFGGTLIVWLPQSITLLTSTGPSSATRNQANPVTFTATLWAGTSKPPGALPISFTLKNPTGQTNIVSGVRVTTNGVASFQWKPASNDPTGTWTVNINDLTSSRAASRTITLN